MALLWRRPERFRTVRDVFEALDDDIAYTTVMTVLSRLHGKGLVERRMDGRAWAYRVRVSQNEYAAAVMTDTLDHSGDRHGTLLQFIGRLTPDEQAALRDRLDRGER
ncbi:BlaI/MecI/CopY family transcriptional regulator [soil metagenome]